MSKMVVKEHGISVAVKRGNKRVFIEVDMMGKLTHEDYAVMIPIIEKALKEAKGLEVDLLIDMSRFKGWDELRAMVDDGVFGLKHLFDFDKVAVVGKKKWEELATKIWSLFTGGKVKFFKERDKALSWLLK